MIPFQVVIGRGCTAETISECIPALFQALKEEGVDLAALMTLPTLPQPQVATPTLPTLPQVPTLPTRQAAGKGPWEIAYNAAFDASLRLTADQDAVLTSSPAMVGKVREVISEYCIKHGAKNGQLKPTITIVGGECEISDAATATIEDGDEAGDAEAGAANW